MAESAAPSGGWKVDLRRSTARVLDRDGRVAGSAFLVGDQLLATCAHVVGQRSPPVGPVTVEFPHVEGAVPAQATVDADLWRGPDREDVAFLRTGPLPPSLVPLPLGSAAGSAGHPIASFGFPANAPADGHYGYGRIGGEVRGDSGASLMQVTQCEEITEGFSGGPVRDEVTGSVIGMVDAVTTPDRLGRGGSTTYFTPVETLRAICRELAVSAQCPYRGLDSFTRIDDQWFFGRDEAVSAVLSRLREDPRMVAVLGPSGSGKSSLVAAGVLPELARGGGPAGSDRWGALTLLPADLRRPLGEVAERWLAEHPQHPRLVVVLDQFEQTLLAAAPGAGADRHAEITALADRDARVSVVLVMRDDFYSRMAALAPQLLRRLERVIVNIPAVLRREDLLAIVEGPARRAGLRLEPELANRIVDDAVAAAVPDTAAATGGASSTVLPLVEFTLTELWHRRVDGHLTHDAYRSLGGVTGGLAHWCEETYLHLPDHLKPVMRRIATALIEPGDAARSVPPVRRRRQLAELVGEPQDLVSEAGAWSTDAAGDTDVAIVLQRLTQARLAIYSRDPLTGHWSVELIHDALIREWPRVRDWLEEDRDFLAWLTSMEDQVHSWRAAVDSGDSPDSALLRPGRELGTAVGWLRQRQVPAAIVDFVVRSDRAARRRQRRVRLAIQALVVLLVASVVLAVTSVEFARRAAEQARLAESRALAVQATTLLPDRPDLAHVLALESVRIALTRESMASLLEVLSRPLHRSRVLSGHTGGVSSVSISPDGALVASAGKDGTVRLWDPAAATPVGAPLYGHSGDVAAVGFSPNGELLASAGADGTVRLWDHANGSASGAPLTGHVGNVTAVEFSPDGRLLASAGADATVRLWNLRSRAAVGGPLRGHGRVVTALAFSPEGDLLASAGADDAVRLWDPRTRSALGPPLKGGHGGKATAVAFSPTGDLLASAGRNGSLRLWKVRTRSLIDTPRRAHTGYVWAVAFSPNGALLASASVDDTLRLRDLTDGSPIDSTLTGHTGNVTDVAFSPDGDVLASSADDGTVRLWDPVASTPIAEPLTPELEGVSSLAYSPSGDALVSAGVDGLIRQWDPQTGSRLRPPLKGHRGMVTALAVNPDGDVLASAGVDDTVRLWDLATGAELFDPIRGHAGNVLAVAFSPAGDLLASGGADGTVRLWDPADGTARGAPLTGHAGNVTAVVFSAAADLLASAGADDTVRLWDTASGSPRGAPLVAEAGNVTALAISPEGDLLASGSQNDSIRLWDPGEGSSVGAPLRGHAGNVLALAFGPDGALLASASTDDTVRLWHPTSRVPLGVIVGHSGNVEAVAISPDGSRVASAGQRDSVRLSVTPSTWVEQACLRVGRNLSLSEWNEFRAGSPYQISCPQYPPGVDAPPSPPVARYPDLSRPDSR